MNPAPTPATRPDDLPTGLTVDEAVRISEAITAAHAESTRTVYAWAWSQWERRSAARGATAMPADPAMICAYLTERAAAGLSVGSIDLACGAISCRHRMHALPDPILTEGVLLTIRRSKADPDADGQVVAVVHGQHHITDPIAALDVWLAHRGADPGRLFTSLRTKTVTGQPISGEAVSVSSTTSMVADSLWGSTPMNTLAMSLSLPASSVVDAGWALLLRAGQTRLEPHTGTVTGGNANRK